MTPAELAALGAAHLLLGPSKKCTPARCNALCKRIQADQVERGVAGLLAALERIDRGFCDGQEEEHDTAACLCDEPCSCPAHIADDALKAYRERQP